MVIVLSLLFVVFATLVAGVYLSVTARAATIGREILFMQADIDELELVNADLATQLAYIPPLLRWQGEPMLGFERLKRTRRSTLWFQVTSAGGSLIWPPPVQ
jgi:hypothetical protein